MTDQRFIITPDGRTLAYAEYGATDGRAVFFFHGMPGSRLFHPYDEITTRLGVRLVCVDRPGYGGSTYQPGRRILDWPGDIATLSAKLGIGKFAVAGHSGGGPYAAACAYALPDAVSAAAILCSVGPAGTPGATRGMSVLNRAGFQAGHIIPWPLWRILLWSTYHRRCEDPAASMERDPGHRPPADEEQISRPEVRQACVVSEIEAFRHGLLGLAWEARLLTRPWGFRLEDIKIPVQIWHGTADNVASIAMAESMAGAIPNCTAIYCPGEAHLLLFPHWEEILTWLKME